MSTLEESTVRGIGSRSGEPSWLTDWRVEAFQRFEKLEWPDPSSEEWRYTDLKGFDLESFAPETNGLVRAQSLDGVDGEVLAALGDVGERDGLAIQVNGAVVHSSLGADAATRGVVFCDIATAASQHPDLLKEYLGGLGSADSEAKFVALAAAIATGGTFLYVPRGVEVRLPLQAFRWISRSGAAVASHTVIVADEAASVTYVDHYASADVDAVSLGVVEIYAKQGANVSYLAVQDHQKAVYHFHVQRSNIGRDASVRSLAATLGGKMSRSVVEMFLREQGGHAEMLGVYFADGEQHFDHRSLQEHIGQNTTSELLYKGALEGSSRAVYSGLIHIAKDSRGADAVQTNRNLILSEQAKADSIPYLEIENNEVRCAHGASVGPVDEEQVFYLQSRGLDRAEAEDLIVRGYFQEVLDRVRVPEVRAALETAIEAELALKS